MTDDQNTNAHDDLPTVYACPECGGPCHEQPQRYGNGWRDCPQCGWRESNPTDLKAWTPVPCDWCGEVEGGDEYPYTRRAEGEEGYYHDGCWSSYQEAQAAGDTVAHHGSAVPLDDDDTVTVDADVVCSSTTGHQPHVWSDDAGTYWCAGYTYLPDSGEGEPDVPETVVFRPTHQGPEVFAGPAPTQVECPACHEVVDIGGDLEDAHMVFAVRQDGTRSNLGWCPNGPRGWDGAVREAVSTWGRAEYQGKRVDERSPDPRTTMTPARALELAIFALNTIAEPDASAQGDLETLDRESQRALATLTELHRTMTGGN
jgi:hypothetical protein